MKILKFSGIVVGVHLLALILIFANPGCSSSSKPSAPAASDTVSAAEAPPTISVPSTSTSAASSASSTPAIAFNSDSVRYSPTRPGTPAASTLQVEPTANVTPATTYTIVSGDNLSVIAKKNRSTIAELAAANNLNAATAKLQPGQKLIIPSRTAVVVKPTEVSAAPNRAQAMTPNAQIAGGSSGSDVVKHVVKARETLSGIAAKYGVKQGEIAEANAISDPQKIRPGMELIIPGWQTGGAKSKNAPKPVAAEIQASPPPADFSTRPSTPAYEVPVIQVEEAPAPPK